jgi:hypothetical protein
MADCDNPDCCPPEFCADPECGFRRELHPTATCDTFVSLADAVADIKDRLYGLTALAHDVSQVHVGWLLAAHVLVAAFLDDITSDDDPFAGSWLAELSRVEAEAAGRPHLRSTS